MSSDAKVTLAEAIRELRSQLLQATTEGQDSEIRFVPKSVEVELGITFTVGAEAGGGVKVFSLVNLSGKASAENESAHKVKLTLEPVNRNGQPALISDRDREK
jgi:hypothetical protein